MRGRQDHQSTIGSQRSVTGSPTGRQKLLQKHICDVLRSNVQSGHSFRELRGQLLSEPSREAGQHPDDSAREVAAHVMSSRLDHLMCTNFNAILTTNYSRELCMCPQTCSSHAHAKECDCGLCRWNPPLIRDDQGLPPDYLKVLRFRSSGNSSSSGSSSSSFTGLPGLEGNYSRRPVLQIHGSVREPDTVVLTSEGYGTAWVFHEGVGGVSMLVWDTSFAVFGLW